METGKPNSAELTGDKIFEDMKRRPPHEQPPHLRAWLADAAARERFTARGEMMNKQRPIRLAELLERDFDGSVPQAAADELRNQSAEIDRLNKILERLAAERDQARGQYENAVSLLHGIHALLYPAPLSVSGRVMVFRPDGLIRTRSCRN